MEKGEGLLSCRKMNKNEDNGRKKGWVVGQVRNRVGNDKALLRRFVEGDLRIETLSEGQRKVCPNVTKTLLGEG